MSKRTFGAALLLVGALLAAGCGANQATPGQSGSAPTPAASPAATKVAAPAEAAPAAKANDTSLYAGIQQGQTAEGYRVLGEANAPVTLVMYSDFF